MRPLQYVLRRWVRAPICHACKGPIGHCLYHAGNRFITRCSQLKLNRSIFGSVSAVSWAALVPVVWLSLFAVMTSIAPTAAAMQSPVHGASLAGEWAGIYTLGRKSVPIQLHFQDDGKSLKGTVDIISVRYGIALDALQMKQDTYSAMFRLARESIAIEARFDASTLVGTASNRELKGTLRLVRLYKPDPKQLRSYEGIYKIGRRRFLIEELGGGFLTFVELPSGIVRGLFAVGPHEFVTGPSLLAAQPEERRLTFTNCGGKAWACLSILHRKTRTTAVQLPIRQEEVVFHNGTAKLAGTLILPSSPSKHPAVVFLHGSGDVPRQSYFGLGYLLASQGIAVLKYDKRGTGSSTGKWLTYEDLADDAIAGARLLETRDEIDKTQIGFWGLSEGGWIAPSRHLVWPKRHL